MATPPDGTKLSLGKLGRATNVGISNYTSKTSLNSAGRDSSTGKTSIGDFYIGSVDNSLDACEESRILPTIKIEINRKKGDRLELISQDNGPGIPRDSIENVFG